ncbi:hypothetical protein [Suttonella ornithocola]|uniref:Uncharacterized protein n=1 Tax=Suttonella ornithocola TaxID=279832 RepID=A0A380MS73_9GAMM|nr:hypothetical protein [Suttonella ornithocola]SUO95440.1 Uncharacterised protein [Suttonella ornithocola]
MKKILATLTLLVIGIIFLSPAIIGIFTEKFIRQTLQNLPITIEYYQKGWFSSDVKLLVTLPNNPTQPLMLNLVHAPLIKTGTNLIDATLYDTTNNLQSHLQLNLSTQLTISTHIQKIQTPTLIINHLKFFTKTKLYQLKDIHFQGQSQSLHWQISPNDALNYANTKFSGTFHSILDNPTTNMKHLLLHQLIANKNQFDLIFQALNLQNQKEIQANLMLTEQFQNPLQLLSLQKTPYTYFNHSELSLNLLPNSPTAHTLNILFNALHLPYSPQSATQQWKISNHQLKFHHE